MAEKNNLEILSALTGGQGQEALQMIQRMERLKRLMGTAKPTEPPAVEKKKEPVQIFSRSKQEDMITAAIPFLDWEFQKEIYVIVRLMEMRRVLQSGALEMRQKQEEPSFLRRRKLLGAIQPYLPTEEQNQMAVILRMMDMQEIMGREEGK